MKEEIKFSKTNRVTAEIFLGILAVISGLYLFFNNILYFDFIYFEFLNFLGYILFVIGFFSIVDAFLRIFNVIPIKRNKDEVNYEMIFFGISAVLICMYIFYITIFGILHIILLVFGCILFVIGIFCIVTAYLRIIKNSYPIKTENNDAVRLLIIGILSLLLGMYMFLNAHDWILTKISIFIGIILFLFGIICFAGAISEIIKLFPSKKNIAKWERGKKINLEYELKEIDEIKLRHENYENKLNELSTKYGDITANITYYYEKMWQFRYKDIVNRQKEILGEEYIINEEFYGDSFRKIENSFIVFEDSSTLFIENRPYSFKDIISFDVFDNSEKVYSGNSITTTKTNTGSMIGRAVVGGALFGGAGAIIGGATAKKESNSTISQFSYTAHKYEIIITVNSLSMPLLKLEIGGNKEAMQQISSILSIIVERNKI